MPAAFYDFFRKIAFKSDPLTTIATIEADSTTDTASVVAGTNIAFTVDDSLVSQPNTLDEVTIIGADFSTYVPLGTTKLRLEKDLNGTVTTSSEVEIYADPLSPILVTRSASNQITISANSPTLPFSQEQIEDFSANMLTGGTHTNITVTYNDNGTSSGTIDLASTDTLESVTGRGGSSTNALSITNATSSTDTTTGALKLTAGGLAVFENINAGGYVSGNTLTSTVATGTAPLTVASTTEVANLRAATSSKWAAARTVTFSGGDVTGSFTIDGSADVTAVALTVAADTVALGTDTTGVYVAQGAVSGNGLSGSANSEGATFTVSSNATSVNTGDTIVFRDASGNFSAGTITATAFTGPLTNILTIGTGLSGTSYSGASAVTIAIDSTVATLTGTQTLTNKSLTNANLLASTETFTNSGTLLTGTIPVDVKTNTLIYYNTAATGNWTFNFRADSGTTLNTYLAAGQSVTVTILTTQGATPFYMSAMTIDGVSVTPKWLSSVAPTSGNANSIDAYSFSILKTASGVYTVLANQTRFA